MISTPNAESTGDPESVQPLRDRDATALEDPAEDPAQAEWDRTEAIDEGASEDDLDVTTATGRDPDEIPSADDEVPAEDLHGSNSQPESQGQDPVIADLGDEGEGDLAPEDD
ncbi:sugar ABC transporter ATPase [Microbacterium sp.]|uniref:sugar ABC transporter ATPase n=1 Tax=Microbacterium sp. TaxID=51671 RepID=UPI0027375568|nr:sugar ABC transporter ATPase [Microbacterium sp.]MDP3953032.1 sugar ABC transporter ATPase [Microbacterium sp.]